MSDQPSQQRLAAVLAADVVGYTRLMERDAEGTVAAWKSARDGIINPMVAEYSGRIVKLTGDGFLAEFPTIHEAVECGIAMQEGFAERSLAFRIGISLGDIIDDGEDIHGEGVNVAARLEGLAEPGGICISGEAHALVRNRVDCPFEDLGEHEVKHVSHPVRVYAVRLGDVPPPAAAATPHGDRPSIAVLPFKILSDDPEQEYFSDGITEDIITELSRFRELFVITRNASFAFKGQPVDFVEVGAKLGVLFVVGGSVRKAGKRVRVTAEFVDAATGNTVWTERYDRDFEDILAVQSDISCAIASAITGYLNVSTRKISVFKVLTFDCYGTLIDWENGILDALMPLAKRAGFSDNSLKTLTDKVLGEFGAYEAAQQKETPTLRYSDLLALVYKNLAAHWGVAISDPEAVKFGKSIQDWSPFPDSVDALAYLNRHYEKLVILSNVDRDSFASSNKLLKVTFGEIYTAEDIGSYKPERRNFEYMLRQLEAQGYIKSDILHVAQSKYHDLIPATEIGLATAWIDRRRGREGWGATKAPRTDARININFYFRSLSELVERHKSEKEFSENDGIEIGYGDFYDKD